MREFCNVNDTNLYDRVRKVPEEKHFWNTQLIDAKISLKTLERNKKNAELIAVKEILETEKVVTLNKTELDKRKEEKIREISEKIEDHKLLLEWLELNIKTISFISQDFKNIIDIKKIEEL